MQQVFAWTEASFTWMLIWGANFEDKRLPDTDLERRAQEGRIPLYHGNNFAGRVVGWGSDIRAVFSII